MEGYPLSFGFQELLVVVSPIPGDRFLPLKHLLWMFLLRDQDPATLQQFFSRPKRQAKSYKQHQMTRRNLETYLKFWLFCHGVVAEIYCLRLWFSCITTPWFTPQPFLWERKYLNRMLRVVWKILRNKEILFISMYNFNVILTNWIKSQLAWSRLERLFGSLLRVS